VAEKERKIGRYVVLDHTARRLVAEARRRPLVAVGVMWGVFLPVAALIAPWQGGARLFVTLTAAGVLVAVSLLLLHFIPQRQRITVDLETGEWSAERSYLFPRRVRAVRVDLAAVRAVRRRRVRYGSGDATKVEWVVELVGAEGEVWPLAEGEVEEEMAELARLLAEVATCPLEEQ